MRYVVNHAAEEIASKTNLLGIRDAYKCFCMVAAVRSSRLRHSMSQGAYAHLGIVPASNKLAPWSHISRASLPTGE